MPSKKLKMIKAVINRFRAQLSENRLYVKKPRDLVMDAQKHEGTSSPITMDRLEIGSDDMMNNTISQLEVAFELGLAGLRQYLNQLAPKDREKVILTITDSIQKY